MNLYLVEYFKYGQTDVLEYHVGAATPDQAIFNVKEGRGEPVGYHMPKRDPRIEFDEVPGYARAVLIGRYNEPGENIIIHG